MAGYLLQAKLWATITIIELITVITKLLSEDLFHYFFVRALFKYLSSENDSTVQIYVFGMRKSDGYGTTYLYPTAAVGKMRRHTIQNTHL